jgi:LacI family transcriptional regulator
VSAKRPTIDEVARFVGVSIKTVSRVFNDEPNVRPLTRDRVMHAAQILDYRPNLSARRLATNRPFVIGMLYDNPNSDYVTEVQHGALQACRENGYSVLIHPYEAESGGLVDEVVGLHRQATVDGLVNLQPVSDLQDLYQALLENNIPTVRVSQRPCDGLPRISVGDEEGAAEMTEHLLSLGHRRIGFIIGHPEHGTSQDRLAGYMRALKEHGVAYDDSLVEQGFFDYESGYSRAVQLLALEPRPTAIILPATTAWRWGCGRLPTKRDWKCLESSRSQALTTRRSRGSRGLN